MVFATVVLTKYEILWLFSSPTTTSGLPSPLTSATSIEKAQLPSLEKSTPELNAILFIELTFLKTEIFELAAHIISFFESPSTSTTFKSKPLPLYETGDANETIPVELIFSII